MEIVKKILDIFKGGDISEGLVNDEILSNNKLLSELVEHFEYRLEQESVGKKMLYPMAFKIIMDPDDYKCRKESIKFVPPQAIAEFYKIIDKKKEKYPDYTPPAKYWYFQFSESLIDEIPVEGSANLKVRKGHITTVSTLTTFDIRSDNNVYVETNTRVSVKLDDSNVMSNANVNWDAIKAIDVLGEGIFSYNFDMSLNRDTRHIIESSNMAHVSGLAVLSYSKGGKNIYYTMKDNLVHISGRNESRKGDSFFIIDSDTIMDSHVQIKYVDSEKKFQIAAYGPVRLNSRKIDESIGRNVKWYDLANNSSIFINNEINVKFKIQQN